ncbi:VOC family protein [Actinomycetospora sp. CA-101289]|uniref:VOC family protein n=1 Tax=Actinomycetospora sp. CA-101289 TaxID=3239893 RepID=UPI003D9701F9
MTAEPAVRVSKLGYVGFETPDVERLVEYYTHVLDFVLVEGDTHGAFLTTGADHHCVVVTEGGTRARQVVGYEIWEDLDAAARRLEEAGYATERRSDVGPGTPDVLVLEEPGTGVPLHLVTAQDPSGADGFTPLRPTKLGHVAAYTPELAGIQGFYQDLLGFRWSDTVGDFFVFLRCNADHHAANFMASTKYSGMHHVAYEMRDPNHLISMLDHLARHSYRLHWGPGRHGPGHNLFTYHRDPDGNVVELFTQIDVVHDEAKGYWEPRPWHEQVPMGPRTWEVDMATVNQWGPIDPPSLDH